MQKGLLTLMVVAMTLVGMCGFAAVPGMWGIPDVIIGDQEDIAVTDNYFVFSDAFAFADYYYWIEDGVKNLKWHYTGGTDDYIKINGTTGDAIFDIWAAGTIANASLENVGITPGQPIPAGATEAVVCDLQVDNYLLVDEQTITVYTADGGTDALTNEYYRVDVSTETLASDPAWIASSFGSFGSSPGAPNGISEGVTAYNGTSDCYTIESTGSDNNWGYWSMDYVTQNVGQMIPWESGAAYILTFDVFAKPVVTPGQEANWKDFIPTMRLRVNSLNEAVNQALTVAGPTGAFDLEVTSDPANPTSETIVFDPRDHSDFVVAGEAYLYASFEMLEFNGGSGTVRDDEGLIGLAQFAVDTFPLKMMPRNATLEYAYPGDTGTDTFAAMEYGNFFAKTETGFGGNPIVADTDALGNLSLVSAAVSSGYGSHELTVNGSAITLSQAQTAKWWWFQFSVIANNQDAPQMRLRVFQENYQRTVEYNITNSRGGYLLPASPVGGTNYNVLFVPKAEMSADRLRWAFDLIDFQTGSAGDTQIALESVNIYSFDPPVPSP